MASANFSPGRLDVTHRRGDRVVIPITFMVDGAPIDVSGRTFEAQVRGKAYDRPLVTTCSIDMAGAGSGVVRVVLAPVDSAPLRGEYVWDFEDLTTGRTWLAGKWTATEEGDA